MTMEESDYFSYMCRLCLARSPQNIDIFGDEGVKNDIQSKIQSLFSVLVKREESLPRTICGECSNSVNFISTFKLTVENAQRTIISLSAELSKTDEVSMKTNLPEGEKKHPEVPVQVAVFRDNVHKGNYKEKCSVINVEETLETSESSIFSGDMALNDPLDEPIKLEQSCEDESMSNANCKDFSDSEENEHFLPTNRVIEFVEVQEIDETYSPTEYNDEPSDSGSSSKSIQVKRGNKRKRKTLKKNKAGDKVESKAAKQPPWTDSMEEEVQNFYQFTCELCSDTQPYKNFTLLCRHYRTDHDTEGYLKCCKRKIYCRSHLYQHLILHTRPEMYKCPECDKQLCGPINLKQHLQVFHLPKTELPFRCSVCARGFATKTAVENHEKSQHFLSREEKFVHACDICGKRFASVAGVSEHKKQVHEQIRPLLCDICAKAFPNQSRLRKHMTTHSDSENIKCPHCDQRLKNYGRLKVHMKRHQGVIHACQQCEKSYPTRRLLQRHIKTHSDERPHECSICGKRYRESSHLKTHFNQHTGAMPFGCQWCPKRFSAPGPFYTHRRKAHPEELARANEAAQPT